MLDKSKLSGIPSYMVDGLVDYVERGRAPGSFLLAILRNDFCTAGIKADMANANAWREWAIVLYNDVPDNCWGSTAKVNDWIAKGGWEGDDHE